MKRACVAVLLAVGLLGASAPALQAQESPQESPVQLFEEGMRRFGAKDYKSAVEVFRRVFQLDPNPFVLYNIARCYEELGDPDSAVRYYQRALALDGLPKEVRKETVARLERLEIALQGMQRDEAGRLARVGVELARVSGGRDADRLSMEQAQERQAQEDEARRQAQARDEEERRRQEAARLERLRRAEEERRGPMTWAGLGLVGGGAVTLGVGGLLWAGLAEDADTHQGLREAYERDRARALSEDDPALARAALGHADEANRLGQQMDGDQALTLGLLGVGALALVGGGVLLWLDTPEAGLEEPAVQWRLDLAPTGAALSGSW
jgi:tetratricopeptide (TPR) repeat protein